MLDVFPSEIASLSPFALLPSMFFSGIMSGAIDFFLKLRQAALLVCNAQNECTS